jgi:hypothetical protein
MNFPIVTQDPVTFGKVSYCSTGKMSMPRGFSHVRGIEFRIPRLNECPSVNCQIVGGDDASSLVIYSFKINDNVDGMTQIAIEAQTLDAVRDVFPSSEASWRMPLTLFAGMSGMAVRSWFAVLPQHACSADSPRHSRRCTRRGASQDDDQSIPQIAQ